MFQHVIEIHQIEYFFLIQVFLAYIKFLVFLFNFSKMNRENVSKNPYEIVCIKQWFSKFSRYAHRLRTAKNCEVDTFFV